MCKKVPHRSRQDALKARKTMARNDPRSYALQPYKCQECRGGVWHLGHPEKWGTYQQWMRGGTW